MIGWPVGVSLGVLVSGHIFTIILLLGSGSMNLLPGVMESQTAHG